MNVPLPISFLESLQGVTGFNREAFLGVHAAGDQVTSVRINPAKWREDVSGTGLPVLGKIPWTTDGYYLFQRPAFTLDPLIHAGAYYVQEASSTFLEQAFKQLAAMHAPLKILDLCAAPGGKSTHILSKVSPKSLLVSNEVIRSRVTVLQENLVKWGAANVVICNNDPSRFAQLEGYFDVMVVDAPCSGSGLFRRDPEAVREWSLESVNLCSQRQQRILADAWPALKKNGMLIYSTCSYSKEENEDILDWMLENFRAESLPLVTNADWNIVETISPVKKGTGYRFYPDRTNGEGFFMACLRKIEGSPAPGNSRKSKSKLDRLTSREEEVVQTYFKENHDLVFFRLDEHIHAIPVHLYEELDLLRQALYLKKAGILMGKMAAGGLIPDHELALNTSINTQIQRAEVDKPTAIEYLRKEAIRLETGMKGWVLVTFKQMALGWMKVLPGRNNNYYPKEWRILKK